MSASHDDKTGPVKNFFERKRRLLVVLADVLVTAGGSRPGLIIGAGAAGAGVARDLLENPKAGCYPEGFLDDDPGRRGMRIDGEPVLGASVMLRFSPPTQACHRVCALPDVLL